jgi:mono/diheme cytochrome c family protein
MASMHSAAAALWVLSVGLFGSCSSAPPPDSDEPTTGPAADATPAASKDGAAIYQTFCAACHQVDGTGRSPSGKALAGSFVGKDSVLKKDDTALLRSIKIGRVDRIGSMPSWAGILSEQERRDVLAYIRTTFGEDP